MAYNFEIAKSVLSDNDKNRLMCLYLNCENPQSINWEKATKDFGSASIESMKVMTRATLKKIEKASSGGGSPAKAAGGKKRKAAADDSDDAEAKPQKSRGKKAPSEKTKSETPVAKGKSTPAILAMPLGKLTIVADVGDAEEKGNVKQEDSDFE